MALQSSFAGRQVAFKPATQQPRVQRSHLIECKESRIGKAPVKIPAGVQYTLTGQHLKVKGPKGELEWTFPDLIVINEEDGALRFRKKVESLKANQLHGLSRTLAANMVEGTSVGFSKTLNLIGVGYRAAVQGNKLTLNLGFSHPVELEISSGLSVQVEKNTTLIISGYDKEQVGQFCATIRAKRPPEPYKGKGVRFAGEYIKLKEGKRGK